MINYLKSTDEYCFLSQIDRSKLSDLTEEKLGLLLVCLQGVQCTAGLCPTLPF